MQPYAGIVATLLLVVAKAELTGALADQRQAALESRGLIVRAKGALMERERLDEHEAFTHLRRAARSSGRKLTEVAREVAAGLPAPAPAGGGPARRHKAPRELTPAAAPPNPRPASGSPQELLAVSGSGGNLARPTADLDKRFDAGLGRLGGVGRANRRPRAGPSPRPAHLEARIRRIPPLSVWYRADP